MDKRITVVLTEEEYEDIRNMVLTEDLDDSTYEEALIAGVIRQVALND